VLISFFQKEKNVNEKKKKERKNTRDVGSIPALGKIHSF
jgi:hypothetical protein